MTRQLLVAAILAGCATIADAATWNFSYVAQTGTLSGQFDGTLLGDGNRIIVSSISGLQFNGSPRADLPVLKSATQNYTGNTSIQPTLSLNGQGIDFAACQNDQCNEGFFIAPPGIFLVPPFISSFGYGYANEPYSAANLTISSAGGAVPEPSSWAMLIAGFGLVGAVARRRQSVARAA